MLSELPKDIQDLLITLPFRVGYYISESDKTGGDESAEVERLALENIVTFYVEDTVKSEFSHLVMNEALCRKSEWSLWVKDIQTIPEECLKMSEALTGIIDMKEIFSFKQNLLEIAIVVAQAYREFDANVGTVQKLQVYLTILMRRIRALFTGEEMPSNESLLNISAAERSAIKLLADTFGITVKF
jgi:hypothetical protein